MTKKDWAITLILAAAVSAITSVVMYIILEVK